MLSDYVLALLKHDAPEAELRTMFVQQLQDFLEKGLYGGNIEGEWNYIDVLPQRLRPS